MNHDNKAFLAGVVTGIVVGFFIGCFIVHHSKQSIMVDLGCGEYDRKTGEFKTKSINH